MSLWSFQGACELDARPTEKRRPEIAGLSKLNSVRKANVEVDIVLGEAVNWTDAPRKASPSTTTAAYRHELPASLERR